jgi:catechol 2,3-dioxygenase-like lactoylglutathione lyase family enzyme
MSVQVSNLDRSADFYQKVLLLPEIECRARKANIRWFGVGGGQAIHLIEGELRGDFGGRSTHFCISTEDLDAMVEHLRARRIAFCNSAGDEDKVHLRADGIRSVYLQDPDGHWLEINEDY